MTTQKKTTSTTTLADFESSIEKITAIVTQLEQNQLPLEKALQQFEAGTTLITQCQQALSQAEQKIQILKQQQLDTFSQDD